MSDPNQKKSELLYQIIYDATKEKFAILPILSGLIIAILSLGVSGGLFQVNDTIKYIATALLLLTILSLQVYFSENSKLLTTAQREFDEHNGKEQSAYSLSVLESFKYLITGKVGGKSLGKDFFDRVASQFSALALLILWFVIFLMIIEIWI